MFTAFKLFFRSIKKNRLFSSINTLGLSVGFFSSILIYIYVENELSYDQFHELGDRVYRVNQTFIWGDDNPNLFSSTGPGVGYAILEEIPEVEQVVRIHTANPGPVRFEEDGQLQFFKDEVIYAVDSNFFDVFSFPLAYGDERAALSEPNTMVLTKEASIRFFGEKNPVGRFVDVGEEPFRKSYLVSGVMEEVEENSYVGSFDALISMGSIDRVAKSNWSWMWTTFETYVLLDQSADAYIVQKKLNALPEKHATRTLEVMGYTYDEYLAAGKEWNLYLQPLEDIYLHSTNIYNRLSGVGNYKFVAALVGSAIFLVILSCINFINLSTAQFTARAKDVALRKVLGGSKSAFRIRFFVESLMFSLISAVIALSLVFYTIPFINQGFEMDLSFFKIDILVFVAFFVMLILGVSLISSSYPFAFFNAFKPMSAMKGEFKTGKKGIRLRNGMLVTQYVLSFLLIICTLTIYKQLQYFLNADVGFEKESLLIVENAHWTGAPQEFADEVSKLGGVAGAVICDSAPLLNVYNGDQFKPDIPGVGAVPLNFSLVGEKFLQLSGVELLVGRGFDESFEDDVNGIVLNETAAETIGWNVDEGILNKKVSNWSGTYHVIGVVKDFNYWTLRAPIEPFAFFHAEANANGKNPLSKVMIKVVSSDKGFATLRHDIKDVWSRFVSNRPFESIILSQEYEDGYQTEERFGKIISFFAVLTIIIASLGLLGIVIFSIEQKLKEVGVRKVLGASVLSIVLLFSKGYVKLILFAFVLAGPAGYYLMENWLSEYEYRIEMTPEIFVLSLSVLIVISLAISTFYSIKASLLNPAAVLKDE